MARPKSEEKRTLEIKVRLTAAEKAALQERADQVGLPLAEYLREQGLGHKPKARLTPEEVSLFKELRHLSNNLNQVAKYAHQAKDTGNISGLLDSIRIAIRRLT
jgi:hypothetical protein